MECVSININFKSSKSELCEIGKKYDTDKSSQRNNRNSARHCHPYTLFYNKLFENRKDEKLEIAELGVLYGASLLMWREYFKNSNIYGFDSNIQFLNSFKEKYDNERISLYLTNVSQKKQILDSLSQINKQFDIIIEDTTHDFNHQINIIETAHQFLKPGGILIIEDVFKKINENDFLEKLGETLSEFQSYYFLTLDHVNRISTGWDNDKLFVLTKKGAEPLFRYVL
jgi:predicted O-methyltransferase YrrM